MLNFIQRSRIAAVNLRRVNLASVQRLQIANYATRSRASARSQNRTEPKREHRPFNQSSIQQEQLPKVAFAEEINAIKEHSSLLNQTTPQQIMNLEDVRPMMALYAGLPSVDLINAVVQSVVKSLRQTAKDASYVFRGLPQDERMRLQTAMFSSLREYLDQVAVDVVAKKIEHDSVISQIFKTYELIDPSAGVTFYENLPDRDSWGGAVIPCMLKVHAPFETIKHIFEKEAEAGGGLEYMKPQTVANMTLACLRHGHTEAAEALFNGLMNEESETVNDQIRQFLIDTFIGDGPAEIGVSTFKRFPAHVPHHSAMSRLLQRMWAATADSSEQIEVFGDYLGRLAVPNEMSIKPVALTAVTNIISGQASPQASLEPIVSLCEVYGSRVSGYELILNMILTQVSQKWTNMDEAKDLVLGINNNYDTQGSDVSFRVRLNSLENVSDVNNLVKELWEARKLSGPLSKFDWFALIRATRNGKYFESEWMQAGQPFRTDVTRFSRSRRY